MTIINEQLVHINITAVESEAAKSNQTIDTWTIINLPNLKANICQKLSLNEEMNQRLKE